MTPLICDEIAFKTSHQSSRPPPLFTDLDSRVVYHTLTPHPAFSPVPNEAKPGTVEEQSRNERAYRQLLVHGALAVLLPTEDLGNPCLRTLVADVIGELILCNGIGNKACEGWLLWEGITKIVEKVRGRAEAEAGGDGLESDHRSRLEKFGLLSETKASVKPEKESGSTWSLSEACWQILQYLYLTWAVIRFIITGLYAAYIRPARRPPGPSTARKVEGSRATNGDAALSSPRPMLSFKIFSLVAVVLDLTDRTPWLLGCLCLVRHHLIRRPQQLGAAGGIFDK